VPLAFSSRADWERLRRETCPIQAEIAVVALLEADCAMNASGRRVACPDGRIVVPLLRWPGGCGPLALWWPAVLRWPQAPIQGNPTFAASRRRRSKMRCDPFSASSKTARSRCSSTSRPPLMAHNRPALPRCTRGRWRQQPNKVTASQPSAAARAAQFSEEARNLWQSPKNWRHRCAGISVGG
jgi:hypothetical protein